ncbi:MAG: hypothetical protein ACRD2G_13910 [Terriglobia bacterium]
MTLKYVPDYPTVTIVETHAGRVMTLEQLKAQGLLAPPELSMNEVCSGFRRLSQMCE